MGKIQEYLYTTVYHSYSREGDLRPRKIPDLFKIAEGTAAELRNEVCSHRSQFSATGMRLPILIPALLFLCLKIGEKEE